MLPIFFLWCKAQSGNNARNIGTNVVIPNGSIDPWHALGKYTSNHDSVVPILINGTAHCADMCPPSDKDKPDLKRARDLIVENIEKWLSDEQNSADGAV
ncbi:unnamed protein product [Strongylus vulgaris]|uniref:Uncharacterized protein n=1 Tax=Strongylus vulgaris TaxID=40348 RepID=A0A3P7JUZ7_STRVU|nr:unnamed protein product [Strongylus vulgaris]